MLSRDEVVELANEFSCPMRLNLMVNDLSENEIDVLFHSVGFVHHGAILDCDTEEFQRSININIYSFV